MEHGKESYEEDDMTKNNNKEEQTKFILQGMWLGFLTFLPVFIGLAIMILTTNSMGGLGFSAGSFVAGFTGVTIMLRKEIPTALNRIQGKRAVVEGMIITTLLWGTAIFVLVEELK